MPTYTEDELAGLRKTKGVWNVGIPVPPDQSNTILYTQGEGIYITDDKVLQCILSQNLAEQKRA